MIADDMITIGGPPGAADDDAAGCCCLGERWRCCCCCALAPATRRLSTCCRRSGRRRPVVWRAWVLLWAWLTDDCLGVGDCCCSWRCGRLTRDCLLLLLLSGPTSGACWRLVVVVVAPDVANVANQTTMTVWVYGR